jgi:hypothetical protein
MGWNMCGSNPGRGKRYFSIQKVQTDSRAHPEFYSTRTKFLSLGWPGSGTDHSLASTAEVKEQVVLYLYSPIRLHGVEREDFSLLPLLTCHWFPVCIPKIMM